ncbi:basic proline-rich protein-like [Oryx dammah]|uniref:basic proline-rich protein-like n=1 Tax=Oryx dammah TaxID=59534 RepID=UPI001A9AB7AF|nr:basic proline-rich protein-like [Oryx dammah]
MAGPAGTGEIGRRRRRAGRTRGRGAVPPHPRPPPGPGPTAPGPRRTSVPDARTQPTPTARPTPSQQRSAPSRAPIGRRGPRDPRRLDTVRAPPPALGGRAGEDNAWELGLEGDLGCACACAWGARFRPRRPGPAPSGSGGSAWPPAPLLPGTESLGLVTQRARAPAPPAPTVTEPAAGREPVTRR